MKKQERGFLLLANIIYRFSFSFSQAKAIEKDPKFFKKAVYKDFLYVTIKLQKLLKLLKRQGATK